MNSIQYHCEVVVFAGKPDYTVNVWFHASAVYKVEPCGGKYIHVYRCSFAFCLSADLKVKGQGW